MVSRKINLISGFVCLLLILSIGSVAVYAFVSNNLHTSATISFTATGINGSISGEATGFTTEPLVYGVQTFTPYSSQEIVHKLPWVESTTESLQVKIVNGSPSSIVFVFNITNLTTDDGMIVSITGLPGINGLEGSFKLDSVQEQANTTNTGATKTAVAYSGGIYTMKTINQSTQTYHSSYLTITFSVPDDDVDISGTLAFDVAMSREL